MGNPQHRSRDLANKPPMQALPSSGQLAFQAQEFGLFCHFGINTFYGKEWSDGTLDPEGFAPSCLDAAQWVDVAQRAGMKYLVFTAKHHDGFCLWPTDTTGYGVRNSPFRGGKGDVVAEIAIACRSAGMAFGLYLSPWDRHAPCYPNKEAYDAFYVRQLTELCTRYGELAYLWFDGAGSEGRVYNWDAFLNVIGLHQPQAQIFGTPRPTVRWIGNEDGITEDPCRYVVSVTQVSAFTEAQALMETAAYLPPECDVAIRQNWFWQPDDLYTLKSREHLLGIWYRSVGRGANLLLNVPPDRSGLLDAHDAARLLEVSGELARRFAEPFPARLAQTGREYVADFGRPVCLDHLTLREDLTGGQQVQGYSVATESGEIVTRGSTIGQRKVDVFPVRAVARLRIVFDQASGSHPRLLEATGHLTGQEELPELRAKLNYTAWNQKADLPEGLRH